MPELVLKLGDNVLQTYVFDKDIMSIGRSRDNDIVIENLSVSRNHARIRRQAGKYILTDLNSANGTFVNGVRVSKTEIVDDDVISMGKHKLQFVNQVISQDEMIVDAFGADRTMVVDRAPTGVLSIVEGKAKGQEYQLTKFETSIGKAASNDVIIADDWFLSKKQVVILRKGADYEIQDLGGFRKTKINGQALNDPATLRPGDTVEIGSTKFVFHAGGEFSQPAPEGRVPQEMALEDSIFSSGASEMGAGIGAASGNGRGHGEEVPSDPMLVAAVIDEEPSAAVQSDPGIEMISLGADLHVGDAARPAEVQNIIPAAEVVEIAQAGTPEEKPSTPAVGKRKKNKRRDYSTERFTGVKDLEDIVIAPPSDVPPPADFYGVLGQENDLRTFTGLSDAADEHEKAVEVEASPQSNADESGSIGGKQGASSGISDESLAREVALWETALTNKSPVIRKQAARMLKKITGRDYEI